MGLRSTGHLRRTGSAPDVLLRVRKDMVRLIDRDGDTVTFNWTEHTGATWNETYEIWEGGEETPMNLEAKGLGKVVPYREDIMEYEWGRVQVGECLIRFPVSFDIEQFKDKTDVLFKYKGQTWKIDSPLGVQEYYMEEPLCKMLKGVKTSA